jgi:excisionase family DNA binding protein
MPLVRPLSYEFKGQAHTKGKAQNSRVRFGRGKATASYPGAKPVLSSSLLLRQSRLLDYLTQQPLAVAQGLEATQSYPNLLSEKQAAKRLGVARITLLRAGEAGRIRFFRIGTRVLYCAEQLTEFLAGCERNRHKQSREAESQAPRKENRVSSREGSVRGSDGTRPRSKSDSRKKDQTSLPFASSR